MATTGLPKKKKKRGIFCANKERRDEQRNSIETHHHQTEIEGKGLKEKGKKEKSRGLAVRDVTIARRKLAQHKVSARGRLPSDKEENARKFHTFGQTKEKNRIFADH